MSFHLHAEPIEAETLKQNLADPRVGGVVIFEGWVRNFNEGREVRSLEYEAYPELAYKEAEGILAEARSNFAIIDAACAHRVGHLQIGELAVWVGVSAMHRAAAFTACEFLIDQLKSRLPIWKKEFYADGEVHWVNCRRCAHSDARERLQMSGGLADGKLGTRLLQPTSRAQGDR